MKKSLLWVLMLALSFVVIPSCGDEEEGTKEETVTSSYEQLGGKYSGDLTSAGTAIAEDLNVNVETVGDNKINLSLDPISIMNIPINDMGFDGIDVVGKDRLGISNSMLKDLNAAADLASRGTLNKSVESMKVTYNALKDAEEALTNTVEGTSENEYWKKTVKELKETLETNTKDMASNWLEYIK